MKSRIFSWFDTFEVRADPAERSGYELKAHRVGESASVPQRGPLCPVLPAGCVCVGVLVAAQLRAGAGRFPRELCTFRGECQWQRLPADPEWQWCQVRALVSVLSPRQIRCSIVVSISACHAEDPGSIPGCGVLKVFMIPECRKRRTPPSEPSLLCLAPVTHHSDGQHHLVRTFLA